MNRAVLAVGAYGSVAVGSSSATELTAISGLSYHPRIAVHFINTGPNTIYYGFDDQVDETNGIALPIDKDVYYEGPIRIWARALATESGDVRVAVFG